MKSKILLIAVVALVIAASVFLAVCQRQSNGQLTLENGQLQESIASVATDVTPEASLPTGTPVTEPTENSADIPLSNSTGSAFSVYINGKTISIAYGVAEKTLDKSPGWLETSALPGQAGMCVIYGHRNRTHLRILETVEAGDSVAATLPDGSEYTYIVTQVQAFEDSADLKIPVLDGKSIALITCYPFRYSGNAPGRYLIVGQLDMEAVN